MRYAALDDTILAVSSAWQPAPLGIIRLSGPHARELVTQLGLELPDASAHLNTTLSIDKTTLPVDVFWFPTGHSYTGQSVVELHTVGSPPWLRHVAATLIAGGARRAQPGEFSARALLNGRLDVGQAEGILGLIHAEDADGARRAARIARGKGRSELQSLAERIAELVGRLEAGIDFTDEEGVQFITPGELRAGLEQAQQQIAAMRSASDQARLAGAVHVALLGLPNAGKSTLFNALLGEERAIVAPVVGTTRDVISAELRIGGQLFVLQDCAGLGTSDEELDLAAHRAAESTADLADVILWVHDGATAWSDREQQLLARWDTVELVVLSKADLPAAASRIEGYDCVPVSAKTGQGITALGDGLVAATAALRGTGGAQIAGGLEAVSAALQRAGDLVAGGGEKLCDPELISLELREAWDRMEGIGRPVVEDALAWVYRTFCVGK